MNEDICISRIENACLSEEQTEQIISLKRERWPYDDASQRAWLAKNLAPDDLHFFLRRGDQLLSYLDAVKVQVCSSEKTATFWGIGNVCTALSSAGKGWASLMQCAFRCFLNEENSGGILLCKDALVSFYQKNGWRLLEPNGGVTVAGTPFLNHVMVVHTNDLTTEKINISRSF